ncbi:MAG: hypothetical protein AAGH71_06230 [Planctomycetota bacterium]
MIDAFWHWLGYAVALASLGVLVWALFWDRARRRGRSRQRCRKCWYDLADVVERLGEPTGKSPITCPECGRAHTKPKQLRRTRRRWRWAVVSLLAMSLGGYGLWVVPRVQQRGAFGLLPTTLLVVLGPGKLHRDYVDVHLDETRPRSETTLLLREFQERWRTLGTWSRIAATQYWFLVGWDRFDQHGNQHLIEQLVAEVAWDGHVSSKQVDRLLGEALETIPAVLVSEANDQKKFTWRFRSVAGCFEHGDVDGSLMRYVVTNPIEGVIIGQWVADSTDGYEFEDALFIRPEALTTFQVDAELVREGEIIAAYRVTYSTELHNLHFYRGPDECYANIYPINVDNLPERTDE